MVQRVGLDAYEKMEVRSAYSGIKPIYLGFPARSLILYILKEYQYDRTDKLVDNCSFQECYCLYPTDAFEVSDW